MYDIHQDNKLLSDESWRLETMEGFRYMWLRWTIYTEAFPDHIGKMYCRTNFDSQGQAFTAFIGCWTKATQQKEIQKLPGVILMYNTVISKVMEKSM